jgi:hypothetical protein
MKPAPQKYRTTNWKAYNAALKARGWLLIWLAPSMDWHGQASGKHGRSPTFSDEAIQFCLSIKCLFSLPLRQAIGMTQSLLHLAGLNWPVPGYSTVSRRQKTLRVGIEVVPTTTGLHLLVDSAGIRMLGEGEWKTRKHGADYRRQWRKGHLGIDAVTLEIRAMEVTDNSIADAPILPNLMGQIPPEEQLASVSGDGAYDTKRCHEAIALRASARLLRLLLLFRGRVSNCRAVWYGLDCGHSTSKPAGSIGSDTVLSYRHQPAASGALHWLDIDQTVARRRVYVDSQSTLFRRASWRTLRGVASSRPDWLLQVR